MGEGQQLQDLRIIVQHLFEMRHQPGLIRRIACEPAADMIINPALRHPRQHQRYRGPGLVPAGARVFGP